MSTEWFKVETDLDNHAGTHRLTVSDIGFLTLLMGRAMRTIQQELGRGRTPQELDQCGLVVVSGATRWVILSDLQVASVAANAHHKRYQDSITRLEKAGDVRRVGDDLWIRWDGNATPDQLVSKRQSDSRRQSKSRSRRVTDDSGHSVTHGMTSQDDSALSRRDPNKKEEETNPLQGFGDSSNHSAENPASTRAGGARSPGTSARRTSSTAEQPPPPVDDANPFANMKPAPIIDITERKQK